jgi:medium-chain acyl-[acyl-carrier-protein] hydrolase
VATQWIVTPRSNPHAAMRLICLPPAGGGTASFRGWIDRLRVAEVGIVELPGRGSRLREPVLESLAAAADGVVDALTGSPEMPTALFGHGLGALVAFEAAHRLESRGWPTLALFVSGQRAPSAPTTGHGFSEATAERLLEETRRYSNIIADDGLIDRESLQLLVPGVRADFAMLDRYVYERRAPLRCPIVALGGEADPDVPLGDLAAWRGETSGRFTQRTFSAGHSYLRNEREAVTAVIANQLSVLIGAMARWSAAR